MQARQESGEDQRMGLIERLDKPLNRVVTWVTAISFVAVGITSLVKVGRPFTEQGWNWAESTLIGLAVACILSLTVSAGLITWRRFRPLPPAARRSDSSLEAIYPPEAQLIDEANKTRAATEHLLLEFKNLSGIQSALSDKVDKAETLSQQASAVSDSVRTDIDKLSDRIAAVDGQAGRLADSIRAIGDRERLTDRSDVITELGFQLSVDNVEASRDCDWDKWEQLEHIWRHKVSGWIDLASFYRNDIPERIYNLPDGRLLDQHWTLRVTDFPDADTMIKYRTFKNAYRNWCDECSRVDRATAKVAYD